jgi:uncharacterized protein YqhQ
MKKTSIGGQALIEGLLMMGPKNAAIAVRKPDGEIVVDLRPLPPKKTLSKVPVVRGVINFFSQMVLGIKALMYSAEFFDTEEEEAKPSKVDAFIDRIFGDKFKDAAIYFAVILSILLSVSLFILLPNLLASFLRFDKDTGTGVILYNLFEGLIRIFLFFLYISLASRMKDIKRVWEYHGAEHKTIHCYEHGDELTVENVRKYSTKHPRCGTSFMFLVMIVSILVFSFLGWHEIWVNILSRIILIPLVAGLSYELLKFAGRHSDWKIVKVINTPGLAFQYFTTSEPDDDQIEVALAAFKNVLVAEDRNADNW